ncbi:MAG: prepilin peptidase [Lentisphaeria bacterium]|nr:prepilin peptidase [Lentisphaeria bacterium]
MEFFETYHYVKTILTVTVFIMGACIGSFLNVVIWRMPNDESVVIVPSHCPKCGHGIKPWENIPIISWLYLRGRCSSCRSPISPRYIFVEFLTGLLFLVVWFHAWNLWEAGVHTMHLISLGGMINQMTLIAFLISFSYIDIDHKIVPDKLVLTGIIFAFAILFIWPSSHGLIHPPGELQFLRVKPALMFVIQWIAPIWPEILDSVQALSVIDAIWGGFVGFGIMWGLAFFGKMLRNKKEFHFNEPELLRLNANGYFHEQLFTDWDDTFIRDQDRMKITGTLKSTKLERLENRVGGIVTIELCGDGLISDDKIIPLNNLPEIELEATNVTIPLEPLGGGDATLMGMIGCFLGAGSIMFILLFASIIGAIMGGVFILSGKGRSYSSIPFVPAIALAALLYMFYFWEVYAIWASLFPSEAPA